MLLLLRPDGTQQPAQLFREHAWRAVRYLFERTVLLLRRASERENPETDSPRYHEGRVEAGGPTNGRVDQLAPDERNRPGSSCDPVCQFPLGGWVDGLPKAAYNLLAPAAEGFPQPVLGSP